MDHVKGALGPLTSKVMEITKILNCKNLSEPWRELISSEMEFQLISSSKSADEDAIAYIELFKDLHITSQTRLNKELESPELKSDFVSLYSKLRSLIREGDYTESLHNSEEVKVWAEVRELSYDLDDALEKFLIYLEDSHSLGRFPSVDELKELMQKMANLQLEENHTDEMTHDVADRAASSTTIDPRIQDFHSEMPDLVGMSTNIDNLKNLVKNTPSKMKPDVACVVGFGGLGKTTLVRTLYDEIKKDFSCKAFVTVGQKGGEKKALIKILLALDNERKETNYTEEQLLALDEWQLIKELKELLCNEKYLIVIDDIWNENLWEFIKCAFPNEDHLDSQVLTTTRSMTVAKDCCMSSDGLLIYQMPPLSDEDSKSLFESRVFAQEGGQCHDDFKEITEAIMKKCGGVPLAINTIASLLGNNGEGIKPLSDWNHLLKSIGSGLTEGDSVVEMNRILSLSYNDLPADLKNCLLYMVTFPEDYVIKKDHLVSKWIAEDFVRRTNQEGSLFEVADNYFNMLIMRSLIEPVSIDGEGKAKACRVHDMVLGFLCSLSSEANFVTIIDGSIRTTSNSGTKIRRLSLQNCMATTQVFITEHSDDMEHVRSFTLSSSNHVFDRTEQTIYKLLCESEIDGLTMSTRPLSAFHVLRVLDLRDCCPWLAYNQSTPILVGGLLHLRYLGLRNTMFNILPTDVGKMKFLQILDLRNHNRITELPSSTVELRGLIYLRVDPKTRLPRDFGKMTSLEKLTHVLVDQDSAYLAEQLGFLTNLWVLRITAEEMDENLAGEFVESLNKLQKIRTLEFRAPSDKNDVSGSGDCVRCMEESWEPSSHLQKFSASNYYCFHVLPKWITEYCNISSLTICVKEVGRDDIEILGRLQCLRYLNLTKEDKGNMYPAKPEEGSQFENDAFPVARELCITGIVILPAMFPKGAMPKVQILEFNVRLEDFGNMNLETAHLPALKKIKVIIWYKMDVKKVTNGAQGSFNENYKIIRNYVHEEIGALVMDAKASLRTAADSHPNRQTTDIETRRYEHDGNLGINKFQLLTGFLKMAEEEAAAKRIPSIDTEAFDVIVSRQQQLTETKRRSHPPLDVMLKLGLTPAAAFREIFLAGHATRNPAKTTNDVSLAFAAKSHAEAVENVMLKFGTLMSMWNRDEDETAEKLLRSSYDEAADIQSSYRPLGITTIDDENGLPSLPLKDHDPAMESGSHYDEANLKLLMLMLKNKYEEEILQQHRVVEESMVTKLTEDRARAHVEASATYKGKEKIIYISSDADVEGSCQPLPLTEIGEGSRLPSMLSLDPEEDELKLALLLSMEDVNVVVDAEVTKGHATPKVNEAEITRPVAQELATTIAEINSVGTAATPISVAESLNVLELNLLSVMSSVRIAKEAIQYELDLSRQQGKDLVFKNTNLDMALAAEKTQVEELKMQLAATQKISSENIELKTKICELSELMKGLVETNKGLVTKFEEAKTKVESAVQFQAKYKDLQNSLQLLEIKDIGKSKHINHLKKENEDLQTKHEETISSFENLHGEMYEKLQDANHYILDILERGNEAMLSPQSLARAASLTPEAMSNSIVTLRNRLEQVGDLVNNMRSAGNLVCNNVWPTSEVPPSIFALSDRLREAPAAIDELKVSAARAGARKAFAHLICWHPDIDVMKISAGYPDKTNPSSKYAEVQNAASRIAKSVEIDEYVANDSDSECQEI